MVGLSRIEGGIMSTEQPEPVAGSQPATPLGADKSGEQLVAYGAWIIIGVFLVFELIAAEYFVTDTALAVAALLVLVPRLAPDAVAAIASPAMFNKVFGYSLALIGVVEILEDVRFNTFDDGLQTVLGAIIAYAGYALAGLGARKI